MLVELLITILIVALVLWLITLIPLDSRMRTILQVVVAVIAIIYLARLFL